MKIQFNTDKTINGEERNEDYFSSQITEALSQFPSHITQIEVHLSDENGKKEGINDIACLLEARLAGRTPIAVSYQSATIEKALSGAIDKLKNYLETIQGRIQNF